MLSDLKHGQVRCRTRCAVLQHHSAFAVPGDERIAAPRPRQSRRSVRRLWRASEPCDDYFAGVVGVAAGGVLAVVFATFLCFFTDFLAGAAGADGWAGVLLAGAWAAKDRAAATAVPNIKVVMRFMFLSPWGVSALTN